MSSDNYLSTFQLFEGGSPGNSSLISHSQNDSGYASSFSAPSISYGPPREKYDRWKLADEAIQKLEHLEDQLLDYKNELAKTEERLHHLESQVRPVVPKRRFTLPLLHGQQPSSSPISTPLIEQLNRTKDEKQEYEKQITFLIEQTKLLRSDAAEIDDSYAQIKAMMESCRRWYYGSSNLREAQNSVSIQESVYIEKCNLASDFCYIRDAIQSTHSHYKDSMDHTDMVCAPKRSAWALLDDEQSKQSTMKVAAEYSSKAHSCYQKFLVALKQHCYLLTPEVIGWCDELERSNLLQAVRLYSLMYGGKSLNLSITSERPIMLEKQQAVFERLTRLAVWVQDYTVACEDVARVAMHSRDAARRRLVELWMADISQANNNSGVDP